MMASPQQVGVCAASSAQQQKQTQAMRLLTSSWRIHRAEKETDDDT